MLTAAMKTKAATDKAMLATWWSAFGLPTRRDQERTLHKLNQLESRLFDLEEQLHARKRELAMDVTHLLEIRPAPRAVFERLADAPRPRRASTSGADAAWTPVTWGQFAPQIRGVARWLIEHELEPGERVAIYAHNSVAWASAALGAQTAGAVFVPIYPASTRGPGRVHPRATPRCQVRVRRPAPT